MLTLSLRPAGDDSRAEEVVITTPSGEVVVVVLLRATGRRPGEHLVGFEAGGGVTIRRRPVTLTRRMRE